MAPSVEAALGLVDHILERVEALGHLLEVVLLHAVAWAALVDEPAVALDSLAELHADLVFGFEWATNVDS